jgi:hypothetical protein
MRTLLWVLLIGGLTLVALWIVMAPWFPQNIFVITIVAALFGLSSLGGFWMLYMAIRHERHPLRFVGLSLLPYAFIWYYFERVRPGKHRTRATA